MIIITITITITIILWLCGPSQSSDWWWLKMKIMLTIVMLTANCCKFVVVADFDFSSNYMILPAKTQQTSNLWLKGPLSRASDLRPLWKSVIYFETVRFEYWTWLFWLFFVLLLHFLNWLEPQLRVFNVSLVFLVFFPYLYWTQPLWRDEWCQRLKIVSSYRTFVVFLHWDFPLQICSCIENNLCAEKSGVGDFRTEL